MADEYSATRQMYSSEMAWSDMRRSDKRWRLILAMTTVLAVITTACASVGEEAASGPGSCTEPYEERTTHQYSLLDGVDPDLLRLDVYASPAATICPVVVWVHGGSWQAGGRRTAATRVKAEHFIQQGYVFVSVNYRLASSDNSVRWPDFGNDIADAAAWTIDNADSIGADPERVSIIGHSSGAHLVSIVATNPDLLGRSGHQPSDLACVVSLDSVTHDLTDEPPWETEIITLAFPSEQQRIDGSPTLQAREHPYGSNGPDMLIVTRGRQPRIESSQLLEAAIRAGEGAARVVDVSPYDHSEVNVQLGVPDEAVVTPPVDEHLAICAAPPQQ